MVEKITQQEALKYVLCIRCY